MRDRPVPPPDVWIDPRLVVSDSVIEGRGLFFTDALPAGMTVTRLGGRLVTSTELKALLQRAETDPTAPYVDTITMYGDEHLLLPSSTPIHFANHSCDPNLWLVDALEFTTRREVNRGDEATIDYGTISGAPGFTMSCRCGTSICRGKITSLDWKRSDLRERYHDHWAPALLERIKPS